jgi:hypothetical protein
LQQGTEVDELFCLKGLMSEMYACCTVYQRMQTYGLLICALMSKHVLFCFFFSMVVEKRLRKVIILSAGILNFTTKPSFKAMNQR